MKIITLIFQQFFVLTLALTFTAKSSAQNFIEKSDLVGIWEGYLTKLEIINNIDDVCSGNAQGFFDYVLEHDSNKKLRLFFDIDKSREDETEQCYFAFQYPEETSWNQPDGLKCIYDSDANTIIKNRDDKGVNSKTNDVITLLTDTKLILENQMNQDFSNSNHPVLGAFTCSGIQSRWTTELSRVQ